ncbi:MAG: phosphoribosylanthranilate isomerase [Terracidiphilus sp.]
MKICANTSLADAQSAADAGADAVGFVFAPSPRRVTREDVAAIAPHLPANLEKIGVFVGAPFEEIVATVEACKLTGVQLHAEVGADVAARLRVRFGAGLRILGVVHFGPDAAERARAIALDPHVDSILVDSRTSTAMGGTGIAYDWQQARATIFNDGKTQRLVVAGGLDPGNVAAAIATLRPWGVDVVSGVEAAPGRKDAAKVWAFVTNARAAERAHSQN